MAKLKIETDRCKGCGLCIPVCPKESLAIAKTLNAKGYFPAERMEDQPCTGCGICMLVCCEMALEVLDDDEV